jgi:Chromatin remodeling protein, contains PhD zinc finger
MLNLSLTPYRLFKHFRSKTEGKLAASQSMNLENLENSNTPKESNEPRYCICNGVSYGDMIKCDNPYVNIKRNYPKKIV